MRYTLRQAISLAGLIALLLPPIMSAAHPEHDFVQASYLTFTEHEILLDIDFRPGFEISEQVLAMIDTDSDGTITESESLAYTKQVTAAIRLEGNEQALALTLLGAEFPSVSMLADGLGIIRFHFSAALPSTDPGDYQVFYENTFAPENLTSHYLVNGFVTTSAQPSIDITNQERDWEQRSIRLSYTILGEPVGFWQHFPDHLREAMLSP